MNDIKVDGARCEFKLRSSSQIANSVRRALLSDVETIAPDRVIIRKNTSCQTDEFIAHRIGLIPFKPLNLESTDAEACTLSVKDRTAMAHDIVSNAYKAYTNMPIIKMANGQQLDLDVVFKKGTGSDHARFSHVSAVSYRINEDKGDTHLSFEVITDESPLVHLHAALESLIKRLDDTIFFVESTYDAERVTI